MRGEGCCPGAVATIDASQDYTTVSRERIRADLVLSRGRSLLLQSGPNKEKMTMCEPSTTQKASCFYLVRVQHSACTLSPHGPVYRLERGGT